MKKLLLTTFLLFSYFLCQAQWKQAKGPSGGNVTKILTIGTTIFAGGYDIEGLFQSTNNGSTWIKVNVGTPSVRVYALDTIGSSIFVGTNTGVFISSNNGVTWTFTNTGFSAGSLPINSFTHVGTSIFAGTNNGVFVSSNGGTSWIATGTMGGSSTLFINALTVINKLVFAGTSANGIYFSADNGASWTARSSGIDSITTKIIALKRSGAKLFAGTDKGAFLSSDTAKTWTKAGLAKQVVNCFAINGSTIFAAIDTSIYLTINDGTTWTKKISGLPAYFYPSALVFGGATLFTGLKNGWGMFISTNNGTSWTAPANTGLLGQYVQSIAMKDTLIVAGCKNGLFISRNSGNTWSSASTLKGYSILSLAISGNAIVAAGVDGSGIWRSTDKGITWNKLTTSIGIWSIYCLTVNGSNIYAGTFAGVYLSVDNGLTWNSINDSGMAFRNTQAIAVSGSTIIAGVSFPGGIYRSINNGVSWIASGLTNFEIKALAVSGTTIYAGTASNGVYMSKDNGISWKASNSGLTSLSTNALANYGNSVFVGTQSATAAGVSMLTPNGWIATNSGLIDRSVASIAISGNNIAIGTQGSSVWTNNLNSNTISGVVKVKAGAVNTGSVELYRYENGAHMPSSDSVTVNAVGVYTFMNVPSGNYVIHANSSSAYPFTAPTYCDSTPLWDSAKIFSATMGSSVTKDIQLVEFPALTGNGKIKGHITKGAGFYMRTIGDPIPGVDVSVGKRPKPSYAIISHTTTDSNGDYVFEKIPTGDYQVLVEIPGLPRESYNLSITATDTLFNSLDYVADSSKVRMDSVVTGIRSFTINDAIIKIYPNPFSKQTLIDLELNDNAPVEIILYNSIGQRVSTIEKSNLSKGHYQFDLPVPAKGVYLVSFNIRGQHSGYRIVEIE